MKERLMNILNGETENRILPFFWQHGEDDQTLLTELHTIYEAGIRSVCFESRPHEGFLTDAWWDDMRLLLDACGRLGMEAWILDDKCFPTGYANGALTAHPALCKRALTEKHMDVSGPIEDGAVLAEGWGDPKQEDRLFAVIACRCGAGDTLTGDRVDLTEAVQDGLVPLHLPEGVWRIFFLFERPVRDGHVDFTSPDSASLLVETVYEPHAEHLGAYFGHPLRGFFSDEPYIMNSASFPAGGKANPYGSYPWNRFIESAFAEAVGADWRTRLPSLWFPMTGVSPACRTAYMEIVSRLFQQNFSERLGDWCRAHGVESIGHIVEDAGQHANMGGGGHYFRALSGQDMAGIDVVLHQIVPGMSDHANVCACWYDVADPDFFHFGLAKLAASAARTEPRKHGQALCEIFGAYGWAEGLKMRKYLTDHMLVRGLNVFVPHSYSVRFPDENPPQLGQKHNPQTRLFRHLMAYMSRLATLFGDNRQRCAPCAVCYSAEADWSGQPFQPFEQLARLLTEAQIDFDVVPFDTLAAAPDAYRAVVAPMAACLPEAAIRALTAAAESGAESLFADKPTETACESPQVRLEWPSGGRFHTVPQAEIAGWLRANGMAGLTVQPANRFLRVSHFASGGLHAYLLTNESIHDAVDATAVFAPFSGGAYAVYDAMENRAVRCCAETAEIPVHLAPYASRVYLFGDLPEAIPDAPKPFAAEKTVPLNAPWQLTLYRAEDYPNGQPMTVMPLSALENVTAPARFPRFGGVMQYETSFVWEQPDAGRCQIDLGQVGETAEVWLNGHFAGVCLTPPYRFECAGCLKTGENQLKVVVTNTLGYEQRDELSKYLLLEPSGLLGPVFLSAEPAE